MNEELSPQEVALGNAPLISFAEEARRQRVHIEEQRKKFDSLFQEKNPQDLDLSDPEGDVYDETFRGGSTYR